MIFITGIPRPPGFFRATGTVDSTAIQDGQVGKVDISTTLIHDHTAKTEPVVGDALLLADSQDSNVNKKATITNSAKATGERFAGTNATSALSEGDARQDSDCRRVWCGSARGDRRRDSTSF